MFQKILLGLLALSFAVAAEAAQNLSTLMVFGDSLSAGYGLRTGEGWVSLLQQRINSQGLPYTVVNASVSGDTTAGGLYRIRPALKVHKPDLVLIELGGNDGLRGLSVAQMRLNLDGLVSLCRNAGATAVLMEMKVPSNYGYAYSDSFTKAYRGVARDNRVALVPFFLESLLDDAAYFQDDNLHPNASAQTRMLDAVWPTLAPLLRDNSRAARASKPVVRP